jgi:hypothetical protein
MKAAEIANTITVRVVRYQVWVEVAGRSEVLRRRGVVRRASLHRR